MSLPKKQPHFETSGNSFVLIYNFFWMKYFWHLFLAVYFLSSGAELNSVKQLVQRVISTLSQTVTDTQSSSLLDLKSHVALGKQSCLTCLVFQYRPVFGQHDYGCYCRHM